MSNNINLLLNKTDGRSEESRKDKYEIADGDISTVWFIDRFIIDLCFPRYIRLIRLNHLNQWNIHVFHHFFLYKI